MANGQYYQIMCINCGYYKSQMDRSKRTSVCPECSIIVVYEVPDETLKNEEKSK